jgi:hypothetical protein
VLTQGIDHFMDGLLARVSQQALAAAVDRVTPPTQDRCPRCGAVRVCLACMERYARELFAEVRLTPAEHTRLKALERQCRALQA